MNTLTGITLFIVSLWVLVGIKDQIIGYMTDKDKDNKYLIKYVLIPCSLGLFVMALSIYNIYFL